MKNSYQSLLPSKLWQVCLLIRPHMRTPILRSKLEQDVASCSKMREATFHTYYSLLSNTLEQDAERVKNTLKKVEVWETINPVFLVLQPP